MTQFSIANEKHSEQSAQSSASPPSVVLRSVSSVVNIVELGSVGDTVEVGNAVTETGTITGPTLMISSLGEHVGCSGLGDPIDLGVVVDGELLISILGPVDGINEGSGVGNSFGPAVAVAVTVGWIVPKEGPAPLPPTGLGVGIERTGYTIGPSVDETDDGALALGEALVSKVGDTEGEKVGVNSLQSRHLQVANVDSKKTVSSSSFQNPTDVPSTISKKNEVDGGFPL